MQNSIQKMQEEFQAYLPFLEKMKTVIEASRLKAVMAVNAQLVGLYWQIGRLILEAQAIHGWGKSVIEKLSKDLKIQFPEIKGFSARNLAYMKAFAENHPDEEFLQAVLAKIGWAHHIILLDKAIKSPEVVRWYVQNIVENGWSSRVLAHQVEANAHTSIGALPNNFEQLLPPVQSDLVKQIFRDEYVLDFISPQAIQTEKSLESALATNVTQFLLALGKGFAFMGRQYHLAVGGQDFYVDMLFYHTRIKCYVVVELKIEDFKPEHAGKLSFYLTAIDNLVRQKDDQPTIGLLLCKSKNNVVVEFALQDINQPLGVASYQLSKQLPKELAQDLPSKEELLNILDKTTKKL